MIFLSEDDGGNFDRYLILDFINLDDFSILLEFVILIEGILFNVFVRRWEDLEIDDFDIIMLEVFERVVVIRINNFFREVVVFI